MISNDTNLTELAARIRVAPWVCLDTEADSLHAYPEKICLVQVTTSDGDELVDPLAPIDLKILLDALAGHELIMHGSDYDLRLFRKHHQFAPSRVFDTMLAARLLGIAQFGLTNLAEQFLGVKLDKGPQKADWARRPLTERMEAYAKHDTHYLKALSDKLRGDLEAKGRLEWHRQCCARLVEECAELKVADPDEVWRIKGSNRLSPAGMAVLREMWLWREDEAVAGNKPPYFILRHESLIEIADAAASGKEYRTLIPVKYSDRRFTALNAAIQAGLKVPPERYPRPIRHFSRRMSEAEKKRVDDIQKRRDARATELAIDPTLIASRATMMRLAENWDAASKELMDWQRELLKEPPVGTLPVEPT